MAETGGPQALFLFVPKVFFLIQKFLFGPTSVVFGSKSDLLVTRALSTI